jgi:thioredoxin-like negative regulator of GroEL
MPMDKFFDVTAASFSQLVNESTSPVIIVCYAPEEGGISNTVRQKFEAEVSKTAGVVLGRLNVETEQGAMLGGGSLAQLRLRA